MVAVMFAWPAMASDIKRPIDTQSSVYIVALNSPVASNSGFSHMENPNVILGHHIALNKGISGQEWNCLYELGMRESGWNHLAKNKVSGAYGIPQSLPASKMDKFGDRYNPEVQIEWMISYIKNRYSTSCQALSFQIANNYY